MGNQETLLSVVPYVAKDFDFDLEPMKLAMVFPGQGSQSVGMMQAYGDIAAVREVLAEASDALGQDLGTLMAEGPAEQLNLTVNTQPVMLTAGYAAYRAWVSLGGVEPALVAGHSLGEYTALVAAGVLSFRDALPLVRFRAQAMQEAVPQGQGAMAAILGLDEDAVRAACAEAARTASSSSPRIAAMAPCPCGTASCIAWARKRTSGSASRNDNTPAATSAVYSPRLCPATNAGSTPPKLTQAR